MYKPLNVLGQPIVPCSRNPLTGWFRDGCCNTDDADVASHTVCCLVTREFLAFLRAQGNDLTSPAPQHGFPGLRPGDRWCVCAPSYAQALRAGVACPVVLESTHLAALEHVPLEALLARAHGAAEA